MTGPQLTKRGNPIPILRDRQARGAFGPVARIQFREAGSGQETRWEERAVLESVDVGRQSIGEYEALIAEAVAYSQEHFEDKPEIRDWVWTA